MDLSISFPHGKVQNGSSDDLKPIFFSKSFGNTSKILWSILNTDIGRTHNDLFESLSEKENVIIDHEPFENLMKRHKSMIYNSLFGRKANKAVNYFVRKKRVKGGETVYRETEPNCENQAHPAEIRERCSIILHKVITADLYGNSGNKKKILKNLFNLMRTAKSEEFSLLPLAEQINVGPAFF